MLSDLIQKLQRILEEQGDMTVLDYEGCAVNRLRVETAEAGSIHCREWGFTPGDKYVQLDSN